MQRIKIDFDNPGLPKRLDVMENDAQSRFFEAELYQGGKAYSAPSGATYSIMYHGFGPQNEGWYDTINDGAGKRAACTVSGNVVTCEIARQALQVPGHVSVVLAVTTAKGYIIKSWPIDCNCRNDNYDSTAEVEGFFYITKITNEEWGKAITAWEDFKNMIDPTLSVSGRAADAAKVGEAVGQIKEDLDGQCASIISSCNLKREVLHDNSIGSGMLTNTARFFLNEQIINKVIESITVKSGGTKAGTVTVEIWELRNDMVCLLKSISKSISADGKEYEIYVNATSEYPMYISYSTDNSSVILFDANSNYKLYIIKDKESTSFPNRFTVPIKCEIVGKITTINKIGNYFNKPKNIVTVGENQDFEEIQDALESVNDTEENPYTFLVMPKNVPYKRFSMIRKLNETYPWVNSKTRYISLVGVDKAHCIIEADSGEYTEPPAEILTNGIVKNLTFKMTNSSPLDTPLQGGYATHIDTRTFGDMGYNAVFEDCDFLSETGPAVGIGLHANCSLTFRRCNFESFAKNSYQPNESYKNLTSYGCVFVHTSQVADAKKQNIAFIDCVGASKESNKSLRVNHAGKYSPDTAEFMITLIRNVFWSRKTNAPSYVIDTDLTLDPMNYGNNM